MASSRRASRIEPEKNFATWQELLDEALTQRTVLNLAELDLVIGLSDPALNFHISTRPSLSFKGNMQVAVAEARNLVEEGNRVAFFANSNGELERLADVLQEYGVPFQLGVESASGSRGTR